MAHILHILNRLAGDGPGRDLIALVRMQKELGYTHIIRLVTCEEKAYPWALIQAAKAGISILRAPSQQQLQNEIAAADIVHLHFWNNPSLYGLLRGQWPPARILIRLHILGAYAPQVLTPALIHFADYCAATSPATLALPVSINANSISSILSPMDFSRFANYEQQPHDGFAVGYAGTLNFGKIHAEFVAMCQAIDVPNVRFVICGSVDEAIQQQIDNFGSRQRFDLRGYVEDLNPVLAEMDVFGYPLAADSYATSEKTLQEAMYVGIPPVVLQHPAIDYLVQHNVTGLVVASTHEYVRAIEYLYHHPQERARLGQNARAYAIEHFGPQLAARQFAQVYDHLLQQPKHSREWTGALAHATPAEQFIDAMGWAAPQFERSLYATEQQEWHSADGLIVRSSPLLAGGEGGVIQYRNAFPDDPWLRYWAGLVLYGQGRYAKAHNEFEAAIVMGLDRGRIEFYLNKIISSQAM